MPDLPTAVGELSLSEANVRLWDERLDCLPVLDVNGRLTYLVFRSDYADNKRFPDQLVDERKRLRVGAGVNTHDYHERVPAKAARSSSSKKALTALCRTPET